MPYAVNPQTGETLKWDGQAWVPWQAGPVPDRTIQGQQQGSAWGPMGGPGVAAITSMAQRMGRAGSRLGNLLLPGSPIPEPMENPALAQAHPTAVAIGQAAPYAIPVPGGIIAQGLAGAAGGALMEPDPVAGALGQGAASAIGAGLGEMAGRVVNGVMAAAKGARRILPSGIEQTTGEVLDSPVMQAAEQSFARNPITGRSFAARSTRNRDLLSRRAAEFLGSGEELTQASIGEAYNRSVDMIRQAVPDTAAITVPESVQEAAKRFNALSDEVVDIPGGSVWTGKAFRNARSDILSLTKSSKASVRERAVKALEEIDAAAEASGTINPELYRQGRALYRRYKVMTAPGVTAPDTATGSLRINEASLDRALGRNYGAKNTQGGISTGDEVADRLIATVRDLRRTRDFTKGSITSTGLGLSTVAADLATTGGVGTLTALGAAELSQLPVTGAFLSGLATPAADMLVSGGSAAARATAPRKKKDGK